MSINRKFLLKKDNPEHVKLFDLHHFDTTRAALPTKVDMRPLCPAVYDQGELGSCTANALGAAYEFDQMKQKNKHFVPSRLFIYYNERKIEGTINEDSGASLSDGVMCVHTVGVVPEDMWPYDISKFKVTPSAELYKQAKRHVAGQYKRVTQNLTQLKTCLSQGCPISFGFSVFSSFQSEAVAKTGFVPMPKPGEENLGGHAVLLVGYDDSKKCFIVRNSWGANWGANGYFYLPYAYVTNPQLSGDFWTIINVIDRQLKGIIVSHDVDVEEVAEN